MAHCWVANTCYCIGVLLHLQACVGSERGVLENLRQMQLIGVGGRFQVPRDSLEVILSDFKRANFGSEDVELSLATALPHEDFNDTSSGELVLSVITSHETYFDRKQNASVTTTMRDLHTMIPILIRERHGMLFLDRFTDRSSAIPPGFSLSNQATVVSVKDGWSCSGQNMTFTMEDGSTLRLTVQFNALCAEHRADEAVGGDFDQVTGRTFLAMDIHGSFDWGCADDASDPAFCEELDKHRDKIEAAGGGIALQLPVKASRRCVATMKVDEVKGSFRVLYPYLSDNATSFETEYLDRDVQVDLVFPFSN